MEFDVKTLSHLANGLQREINGEEYDYLKDREVNAMYEEVKDAITKLERAEQYFLQLAARYDYVG